MKNKIVGICICMLLITTCAYSVCGTTSDNNLKKSPYASVSLNKDYTKAPLYKRSLQDIISGKPLPSLVGTRPLLVILTNYKDRDLNATHNVNYFTDMMWGPRPSLSDYFSEVSYGKFTYSQADVVGWYKIDVTGSWAENNTPEFAVLAITAADEDFDYSTYDTNNDGLVTNEELTIVIVHPSNTSFITSWHFWSDDEIMTDDGVSVEGEYSFLGEWTMMGIFAHEIGHDLGLPDLYDLGWDSNGIGGYGLMGLGAGGGPSHMTAWEKIQLGWLIPTVITINGTYTLNDVETHAEAFILCDLQHSSYEYFLIENRFKGISYDSINIGECWSPEYTYYSFNLSDEGILIYHIDDRKAFSWWNNGANTVNTKEEHKGVDVECADSPSSHFIDADDLDAMNNSMDESDLWDITTYDFDDFSNPCNATWYDGTQSGLAIRDFSAIGSTMTMNIFINSQVENHPPTNLSITGPASGKVGKPYKYSYVAEDPENQYILYYIDWGDGTSTEWTSPEKSGLTQKKVHSWAEKGNYSIRIKAKDVFGAEGDWATLTVTMPYTIKPPFQQFFDWLFQRFPNAFPLLRHLLGY